MPSIGLAVSNPVVTYSGNSYGGRGGWRLSFEGVLADSLSHHVDLTTEEKEFSNLAGTVAFEEADGKEPCEGFVKDALTYWKAINDSLDPQPASWLATIHMPSKDLQRLLKTIADSLPLRSVNIDADGLEFGWEPDGSGKKWDNAATPALAIKGYRLFFGSPEKQEILPDPPEPEIQTDLWMLTEAREARKSISYLTYAVIGLIVVLFNRL